MKNDREKYTSEIARIRRVYQKYDNEGRKFWESHPYLTLYLDQHFEQDFLNAVKKSNKIIRECKILDVGAGEGLKTRRLNLWVPANKLYCIDLVDNYIQNAQSSCHYHYVTGDAGNMPFTSGVFDVVFQATVFSSILNPAMRSRMASEMMRVLAPSGIIISWDAMDSRLDTDIFRSISDRELEMLFPNCEIKIKHIVLRFNLLSKLVNKLSLLCQLLEKIPGLTCFSLATIHRRNV